MEWDRRLVEARRDKVVLVDLVEDDVVILSSDEEDPSPDLIVVYSSVAEEEDRHRSRLGARQRGSRDRDYKGKRSGSAESAAENQ